MYINTWSSIANYYLMRDNTKSLRMKKLLILFWIICFSNHYLTAQEYSKEFRVIGQDEINMSRYSNDSAAEAVILFDIGESKFIDTRDGYDILFTRTKRIKILSPYGIKYAEVSIPFYADGSGKTESVESIEAYSYSNDNGKLTKTVLDQNSIHIEKINNRWSIKKFVFPDVRTGTIIEFRYVLETPFIFNLRSWEFQSRIPTILSQYTVRLIPFYEYAIIVQGISKFDYQNSTKDDLKRTFGPVGSLHGQNFGTGVEFQDLINTYVMKNVPAFKDESYITSASDFIMKMDFQLAKFNSAQGNVTDVMTTWPKMVKDLLRNEDFGTYLKNSEKLAKKIIETEISLNNKSKIEKCQMIINYVKSGFRWNGASSVIASMSAKDFLNQKKGNSADINLFLVALLKSAGIDANPVILSTRDHGKIKLDYPFIQFFNYVVALVNIDNHAFLTDGTELFISYNRIPPKCINERGLIVSDDKEGWVNLNLGYNSIDDKTVTMIIDPETLKAKTNLTIQALDFDSFSYKKSYLNDTVDIKYHFNEMGISMVTGIKTMNYENAERPYIIMCDGETNVEKSGNKIIVSPFLNFFPKTNKFTQTTRTYPLDFTYSNTEKYKCTIKIPEGFKVSTIPETYKLDDELVQINLEFKEMEGNVNINASYSFKKAVYQPEDYPKIKSYMDTIVNKFNDLVIFEKN